MNGVAGEVGDHFHNVGIADLGGVFDAPLQRTHGSFVVIAKREHRGVDSGGIDERFVALNVDHDLGGFRRCHLGDAVCARGVIGASHSHRRSKRTGRGLNARIVGGDQDFRYVAGLRCAFVDVLQQRFSGERGECFTWETRGGEPGRNNAQDSGRHIGL